MATHDRSAHTSDPARPEDVLGRGHHPIGGDLAAYLPSHDRDRFIEALDEAVNGSREPGPEAPTVTEAVPTPPRRRTRRAGRRIGR
jgi:hypothetical protein